MLIGSEMNYLITDIDADLVHQTDIDADLVHQIDIAAHLNDDVHHHYLLIQFSKLHLLPL